MKPPIEDSWPETGSDYEYEAATEDWFLIALYTAAGSLLLIILTFFLWAFA